MRFKVISTFLFSLTIIIVLDACQSKETKHIQGSLETEQIDNHIKIIEKNEADQNNVKLLSTLRFFNEIKSTLPYSLKPGELIHFGPDGADMVLRIHKDLNFTLVSYTLSFASEDHLVIVTYDNKSGKLLHKIDIEDYEGVKKMEFLKDSTLIISVQVNFPIKQQERSEFYVIESDIQFFEVQKNGAIQIINWGPDTLELLDLSNAQLRLIRNRVFAKYGYIFSAEDLREYFLKFSWYQPISTDVTDKLTPEDKEFIEYVQSLEE